MKVPETLKYTKDHEWVKIENDIAIVGITDFAQQQLTDIVYIELPEKGKVVEQSEQLAVIESVKSVSDVFAPISGEVIEVNEKLNNNPEKINQDPYGEGWIAKIKIKDREEVKQLMSAEEYKKLIEIH